jgi:16S rRNA processing protein RimM
VPEDELQPLGPGTYYHHQLIGCAVETVAGERVGNVVRVDGGAAGSVLEVEGPHGEVLIPLAVEICVEIDVGTKRIRINPPEGLLDINRRGDDS